MGEPTIWTRIKLFIGGIGWKLFLWGASMTEEEYFENQKFWSEEAEPR